MSPPVDILVPVDYSDGSRFALQEADALATARNCGLTLLHVHPIVEVAVLDFTYLQPPERMAEVCDVLERRLREWAKPLHTPVERVKVQVLCGNPVAEITGLSKTHGLIVMATRGRTGMSHFLLGSVTERVVAASLCSVLVVKRPHDSALGRVEE